MFRFGRVADMLLAIITLFLLADDRVPAHKMSDLQRAQRRMHEGDAQLRKLRGEMDGLIGANGTGVTVIGKHDPELLMRWELMNHVEGTLNSAGLLDGRRLKVTLRALQTRHHPLNRRDPNGNVLRYQSLLQNAAGQTRADYYVYLRVD